MVHRHLGRTGLEVSPIGFGAFKIGRNVGIKYPEPYDLPDERASAALLNAVLDLGINYIDTAAAYGSSEERVGRALASRRHEVVLSTKAGESFEDGRSTWDYSSSAMRRSVQRSLHRLQTDVVDVLFLHAGAEDLRVQRETDVVETMLDLRKAGLARAVGFSGKTTAGAKAALAWADVLMIEYHTLDRSHGSILDAAHAAGVGVVVKKGLASGRLAPAEAIPFVLECPSVASLVIGGLEIDHVRQNVAIATGAVSGPRE